MKYVDEYRDGALARRLAKEIASLARGMENVRIMEVCGGHTHAIAKHGLEDLLPPEVEYLHGPGCPVCVIPMGRVDDAISLAERPNVIFTTSATCCASPAAAGRCSRRRPAAPTSAWSTRRSTRSRSRRPSPGARSSSSRSASRRPRPATAVTLLRARAAGVRNFSRFLNHVTIVPPLQAILDTPGTRIDAFIAPGHVSTVIGTDPYRFIPGYGKQVVVSAFEPLDILESTAMILRQRAEGRCELENQYTRVVRPEGNPARDRGDRRNDGAPRDVRVARARLDPVERAEAQRGLRRLGCRGALRPPGVEVADPKSCQCGEVLVGAIKPWECKVFGTACTPERPLGTCMVSSEGACAAYYSYGRRRVA